MDGQESSQNPSDILYPECHPELSHSQGEDSTVARLVRCEPALQTEGRQHNKYYKAQN
uniref:Uncharacterized protein n=1 Tax=Sendai virus (strain Enders) TaxID=11194 RepID=Q84205_SENDE|nr:unknown protein [Human respirovirus 1]